MGRTYNDEYILAEMSARLVPPDDRYPDCRCAVLLTEERLYILEENYDGTYVEHISIPTGDILTIEQEAVQAEAGKGRRSDSESRQVAGAVATMFLGLVGGVLAYSAGGGRGHRATPYLRVIYRDETGAERRLYCRDCAGSVKRMGKALAKYRERRGLCG